MVLADRGVGAEAYEEVEKSRNNKATCPSGRTSALKAPSPARATWPPSCVPSSITSTSAVRHRLTASGVITPPGLEGSRGGGGDRTCDQPQSAGPGSWHCARTVCWFPPRGDLRNTPARSDGQPWKQGSFDQALERLMERFRDGNIVRPDLDTHGLRHARGIELAHAGATEFEIMTHLEHATSYTARIYIRQANRAKGANSGQAKIDNIVRLRAEKRRPHPTDR